MDNGEPAPGPDEYKGGCLQLFGLVAGGLAVWGGIKAMSAGSTTGPFSAPPTDTTGIGVALIIGGFLLLAVAVYSLLRNRR